MQALREAEEESEEMKSFSHVPKEYLQDAREILESVAESLAEDMSLAYAYCKGVLYVRIYDGERYVFPLPFMLTDSADASEACIILSCYARRELIPLFLTDIPREEMELICGVFPHVDAFCYEEDDDSFFARINNECDMLEELPSFTHKQITLDAITEADEKDYAQLCSDTSLNKYWGYDVSADNPDCDPKYYLSVAEREFADGVALTLAIRYMGEFAGEAVIYDFDYLGSAQIAVRVIPSFHGKGIGTRATEALIMLAKEIGLDSLRAEILDDNAFSIRMASKFMKLIKSEKGKSKFTLKL